MGKKKAERDDAYRVYRGGGWYSPPSNARVASRLRNEPGARSINLGVRLVRHRSALERLADGLQGVTDDQEG